MMPDLRILTEIDLPTFPKIVEDDILKLLRAAALRGAEVLRELWEQRARELDIRHTGSYVRGITKEARVGIVEETQTETIYEVVCEVTNTSPHASIVEEGHRAFHLPEKIDWSSADGKIKRTKAGQPYLSIPFRHFAFVAPEERGSRGSTRHTLRNMMPREVYREAAQLERSYGTGTGRIFEERTAAEGGLHRGGQHIPEGASYEQHVAMDRYRWAQDAPGKPGSLRRPIAFHRAGQTISDGREAWTETRSAKGENPAWQGSKYEGMRKMGPKGHTAYMTFRTLTPNSPGWHIPAQPGHHIAAQVAEVAGPTLGPFIEEQFGHLLEARGL